MATRKAAPKKKTEWSTETLAEYKQSAAIVWRAQKSESPQGQTFVGIRRFRVDAEGTEMPDGRCGFQVKEEGSKEVLTKVHALLGKLLKSIDEGSEDDAEEEAPAKPAAKKVSKLYAIKTKNGKFFSIEDKDVKVVAKIKDASHLSKSDAQEVVAEYDASTGLTLVPV